MVRSPSVWVIFACVFFSASSATISTSLIPRTFSSFFLTSSSGISSPFSIFFISRLPYHQLKGEVLLGEPFFHTGPPYPVGIILNDFAFHVIEHVPFPLCRGRHRGCPGPGCSPACRRSLHVCPPRLLHLGPKFPAPAADLQFRALYPDQFRDAANGFPTHFALHILTNTLYDDFPI